ncbi:MAG: hypothetical protein PHQ20_04925, partial [Candidatus Moranbacteria bacterium]|nr:hypothetical protein [Candidatus Moranbacteria bacterium]
MKRTIKKIIKLEFYQDILIKLLRFFIQRNPLFVYFWIKCYLFDGVFRRDEENKKLFYGKYQSFNQKHPYLSAGSSFVLILAFVFSFTWFLFLKDVQRTAAWPP